MIQPQFQAEVLQQGAQTPINNMAKEGHNILSYGEKLARDWPNELQVGSQECGYHYPGTAGPVPFRSCQGGRERYHVVISKGYKRM